MDKRKSKQRRVIEQKMKELESLRRAVEYGKLHREITLTVNLDNLVSLFDISDALLRLCRELQCPAIEYLNENIRTAWAEAFNLVDPK